MSFEIPKDAILCSTEEINGQRYVVIKAPVQRSLNEVLKVLRLVWANSVAHKTGKNSFLANEVEDVEAYHAREAWNNQKIRQRSVGKRKVRRSHASVEFHAWVKKKHAALKKIYRYETKSQLAKEIFEANEGRIASLKSMGKPAPRHYSPASIKKILSL